MSQVVGQTALKSTTQLDLQSADVLESAVFSAANALMAQQDAKGYWVYELEADCTIPSEYILMMHFTDEVDVVLQDKLAVFLRASQMDEGGWPLYQDGAMDLSCSVKVYYALKLAGDAEHEPHMVQAREAILSCGGAAECNVFTRIALALFEQLPWRAVPFIPVEIMLLPKWFPFHLSKVSYWSRAVMVPLFVLCSLKPKAANPHGVDIRELFVVAPEDVKDYFHIHSRLGKVFLALDHAGRFIEPLIPGWVRKSAIKKAENWIIERLNGTGGLGGILPAMVSAYEVLALLGYEPDHPHRVVAKQAMQELLVEEENSAYCQPCVSPVWDTALACHALQEINSPKTRLSVHQALNWLQGEQLLDEPGDWQDSRPDLKGGGWPFQFKNSFYPDLDDTAAVVWTMENSRDLHYGESILRAVDWLCGMQSKNGGFAAFDVDNTCYYLNEIPFADHGALLDPPSADVSARCVASLARFAEKDENYRAVMQRCIAYLKDEQEADGSWFGRWGTNYIYGTWSVLTAFEVAGISSLEPCVQRAVQWLKDKQRADGGWGESNESYEDQTLAGECAISTSFQTAWALLALMASDESESPQVKAGIDYLLERQQADGLWQDKLFTAPGFPRVFYLNYHGYSCYFPVWALARYRNIVRNKQQ